MPSSAAIYCRISQDRTGQGLGVGRQEQDCKEWATRNGWGVAEVYVDDDISAYSGRPRPSYKRLTEDVAAGRRDGLIAWDPDRLHRSPRELEDFIDLIERTALPVGMVMAGAYDLTTSNGRLLARMLGNVARHESEHKSERIRRKALELAQNGKVGGGGRRPFGFDSDRVTVREDEAALIREAADRVLAGDGVRTVAADWNERGIKTVTGAPWSATTVKRLLRSGRIVGWREHHGKLVAKAEWPAIIDADLGRKLRRLLDDPARNLSGGSNPHKYLLAGMLRCGLCGAQLTSRPVMRKGHRYRRYACVRDRGGCNRVGIGAEPLEELISDTVIEVLNTPALARAVAAKRRQKRQGGSAVEDVERRMQDLAEMFAAGEIGRAEWSAARSGLVDRLNDAKVAEAAEVRDSATADLVGSGSELREQWPHLSLDRRRAVVIAVLDHVTIAPTSKAGNRFDPERVAVTWRY